MDIKEEHILGSAAPTHWYYVAKGRALCQVLRSLYVEEALDVGAGSGVFSRQLLDAGICRRAVCVDPYYVEERVENYRGREIMFTRSVPQVSQKLILMMDVLEHVDDDMNFLSQYTYLMPLEGWILITVPAFQFLWSGHDEFLEHRRRYTLGALEAMVQTAGLHIVDIRYFFGLLFPIVALLRWRDRRKLVKGGSEARSALKKYAKPVNTLLTSVHDIERTVLFPINRFAGLTIFCLARRSNSDLHRE